MLFRSIEQIAPTDGDAAQATTTLATLVTLGKSIEQTESQMHPNTPPDPGVRELINSAKVEQHKDHAILTANIPIDLVKKLATPSPEGRP